MEPDKYRSIYSRLNSKEDLKKLGLKYSVNEDVLEAILVQKIIRETKTRYYIIKKQIHAILKEWETGKSFLELSHELNFTPALTASLILQEKKHTKKQVRDILHNPETIRDPRLKRELKEALSMEVVYSPEGTRRQTERGKMVEHAVKEWLTDKGIRFMTEYDSRRKNIDAERRLREKNVLGVSLKSRKTPDFLLAEKIKVKSREVGWVECKASFGDREEVGRDYGKQLKHYGELFGVGVVVYWYGLVDGVHENIKDKNVILASREIIAETQTLS